MLADRVSAQDLTPMLSGLLREAGVTQQDRLIGLGDGAPWVEGCFESLGIPFITDVYHATDYLDTLMQAMNWSDARRSRHRRNWCKAKSSAKAWLKRHVPKPQQRAHWPKDAHTAFHYLESRQAHMDYSAYHKQGFPIGSGQVEGMNKSVIGNRMKRSGMQWTEQGAARMASLRAQTCAKHSLIDFQSLRHSAFPCLQS